MDLVEAHLGRGYRHPWELARGDAVLDLLDGAPLSCRYADVGAGDLYFALRLAEKTDAPIHVVDPALPVDDQPPRAGIELHRATTELGDASVDCVLLMDVLEHVPREGVLLSDVRRILTSGGRLVVTVPAHAALFTAHDTLLGHERRYGRRQLLAVLDAAGFDVEASNYCFAGPLVVRAIQKAAWSVRPPTDHKGAADWGLAEGHALTRALRRTLVNDFRLSRRLAARGVPMPGLSVWADCRMRE